MAVIRTLEIRDFGPFEHATLELSPLTVIVGPNDSGKSTILNAVRVLAGLADPERRDGVSTQARKGSSGATVAMTAQSEQDEWAIDFQFGVPRGRGRRQLGVRFDGADVSDPAGQDLALQFDGQPPWAYARGDIFGDDATSQRHRGLQRLLAGVHFLKPNPDAMRQPAPMSTTAEGADLLAADGSGLPSLLAQLGASDPRRALDLMQAFVAMVPTLSDYALRPTDVDGKFAYELEFRGAGRTEFSASEVSDGVILLLAFLALANLPEPPSVLLVEEPENGMHPARLREILTQLRKLASGDLGDEPTQVIITTHMPYLLDEVEPEEAFFCVRDDAGIARVVRFSDVPGIHEELNHKLLGELWAEHREEALYARFLQRNAAK